MGASQPYLALGVKHDTIRVRLLEEQFLGVDIVDQTSVVVINHSKSVSTEDVGQHGIWQRQDLLRAEVQASNGSVLLDKLDRESIVDKDLHDLTILQAHQQSFATSWTASHLDVADKAVHDPFPVLLASKAKALEASLLTEDNIVCADNKQVAIKLLLDLVDHL